MQKSLMAMSDRTFRHVWWISWGPNTRKPLKPMSGSPTNAGPSRSASAAPGMINVKLSSVGATPAVCTLRWHM